MLKSRTTLKSIAGAGAAAIIALSAAGPALAYTVYQLEDDYYAIRCKDGTLHSYSGSASGLSTVGPALCEKHGGVVGGPGGGASAGAADVKPARKMDVPAAPSRPATKELDKASPKLAE